MRTEPKTTKSDYRDGNDGGGGSSEGTDNDEDWNGPPRSNDMEEAGYGNMASGSGDKSISERKRPAQGSSQNQGRGSGRSQPSNGSEKASDSNSKPVEEGPKRSTDGEDKGGDSDGGKSWNPSDRSESSGSTRWTTKHEFIPRDGAKSRHHFVFRDDVLNTMVGTPGARLDMIIRKERHNTPGFTLGHGASLYGFDFGVQPVPIWDIVNIGGGQLRKVEEANVNKAIVGSLKLSEKRLTTMTQLINVTYNICAIWGRWYKAVLVEIAMIIDQEIRHVTMTEGWDAPQSMVDAYVALIEGVLGNLTCTLTTVSKEGFEEVMMKEIDRVKWDLSPASPLHKATVYQAKQRVFGEAFSRGKRGGERLQDREERRNKNQKVGGGWSGHGTVARGGSTQGRW